MQLVDLPPLSRLRSNNSRFSMSSAAAEAGSVIRNRLAPSVAEPTASILARKGAQ